MTQKFEKLRSKITTYKRRLIVFLAHLSKPKQGNDLKLPKMTPGEEQAVRIWTRVVHQPDSNLMYNPQTQDCYAQWDSKTGTIYIFLEQGNLRIINTVVGYDVRLSHKVEQWCDYIFAKEVAVRRKKFRRQAESKVVHSLESLESRITDLPI